MEQTQVTPISAILFDKDGTLFDFHATWGGWMHELIGSLSRDAEHAGDLAKRLAYDLAARRFRPESPVIAGSVSSWSKALLPLLPEHDAASLNALIIDGSKAVQQVPAVPLAPLLGDLRDRDLALGVATNDAEEAARAHLQQAGIAHLFDHIAGYDSGHGPKPGPGMLLAFARKMDVATDQIAMVGDSTHDLHAAKAAGMIPVAVLTGMAPRSVLEPLADVVLEDIGALPDWLVRRTA